MDFQIQKSKFFQFPQLYTFLFMFWNREEYKTHTAMNMPGIKSKRNRIRKKSERTKKRLSSKYTN